jgi:hypothetical protein
MRADEISVPPRARNWQSQRVTPRSGAPGTGFHPDPAQFGQTSASVFIRRLFDRSYFCKSVSSTLHPNRPKPQLETMTRLCTTCGEDGPLEENWTNREEESANHKTQSTIGPLT